MLSTIRRSAVAASMVLSFVAVCSAQARGEPAKLTPQEDAGREVTTEELQILLATGGATVLDARPYREYAISHIPGAVNVAPKPGMPMSMYVSDVAEIGRLLNGNKAAPLVVYCNGPHCGKSRRLAAELRDAGYSNVRRYQLGIPTWRAAGGVCAIELDGIRHIVANDRTAVVIDSREPSEFHRATVRGAKNIPRSLVLEGKDVGEVNRAKDDGRLPMEDHNTRIVVLGTDAAAARYVAEALAREAFHNVSFFSGPFATVHKALTQQEARPEVFQRTVSPPFAHLDRTLRKAGSAMSQHGLLTRTRLAHSIGMVAIGSLVFAGQTDRPLNGTIWAANRGNHTIQGFDAGTGAVVATVAMTANSQPGDLAHANGKLYVAEEFGTPPAIAIVDPQAGAIVHRLVLPAGARPHHVHASVSGSLIAAGLFGTDLVAVVDTHDDTVLGLWDSNPLTITGRVHAGVFSKDGNTLYLAVDVASELVALDPRTGHVFWRMSVPGVHEIAVMHNGRFAYVSRRSTNKVAVVDLDSQTFEDVLTLALPDTLRLSADEKLLTIGLRSSPAQLAVVDTSTFAFELVTLSKPGETTTIAGHQWTSPSGRYTFAAYEGGAEPGIAVIDHADENRVVQTLAGRPHGVDHVRP